MGNVQQAHEMLEREHWAFPWAAIATVQNKFMEMDCGFYSQKNYQLVQIIGILKK